MPISDPDSDEILNTISNELKRAKPKTDIGSIKKEEKKPEIKKVPAQTEKLRVYHKIKIVLKQNEETDTIFVDDSEKLENAFKIETQNDAKILYKNIFVSKYMTLAGLKAVNGDEFEIVKTTTKESAKAVEVKKGIKIKILYAPGNFFMLENVDEKLKVKNLLELCKDKCAEKRNILLMNGTVLKENQILEDCLEDEELLDYV